MKAKSTNELVSLVQSKNFVEINKLTVDELVKVMKKLSDAYYNSGIELVSDSVYDQLRDLLEDKDPDNPYLFEVGAPVKGTKEKVKLPFEMGSLKKITPLRGDLDRWISKYDGSYIVSDKLDGASVQLYKNKDGQVFLYSRGKSTEGQNISHLIPFVVDKKAVDNLPEGACVRGELIISKKNFKTISSYMKNVRNAVAGLVNSKTVDKKVAKITEFVTYSVLNPRHTKSEQFKLLKKWGFTMADYVIFKTLSLDKLSEYLTVRNEKSNYKIDGIVVVDNSKVYKHEGGHPEYAFAFKMTTDDQVAETKVVKVHWEVSMDGYIKPTIQIEPVELCETTNTYATAFNAKFIVDNGIGKGAKIKIVKSGAVIPYIYSVISPSKTGPEMPDYDYVWNDTKVDIKVKKLVGKVKTTVIIKLLTHFFKEIKVKYMSEGIITKIVNAGYDSLSKILLADHHKLANIEGLGEKSVKKIFDEIDRAFAEMDLATFMGASHKFGRGLGVKKIQEIISVYPNILNNKWDDDEFVENIKNVDGFSDKLANLFVENYGQFIEFYNEISKIKDLTRFKHIEVKKKGKLFKDQHVVFTGFRDKDLEKYIVDNGGKVSTSVSSNTTILVCKDGADQSSSKFQKAKKLGTKILTQSQFEKEYRLKK